MARAKLIPIIKGNLVKKAFKSPGFSPDQSLIRMEEQNYVKKPAHELLVNGSEIYTFGIDNPEAYIKSATKTDPSAKQEAALRFKAAMALEGTPVTDIRTVAFDYETGKMLIPVSKEQMLRITAMDQLRRANGEFSITPKFLNSTSSQHKYTDILDTGNWYLVVPDKSKIRALADNKEAKNLIKGDYTAENLQKLREHSGYKGGKLSDGEKEGVRALEKQHKGMEAYLRLMGFYDQGLISGQPYEGDPAALAKYFSYAQRHRVGISPETATHGAPRSISETRFDPDFDGSLWGGTKAMTAWVYNGTSPIGGARAGLSFDLWETQAQRGREFFGPGAARNLTLEQEVRKRNYISQVELAIKVLGYLYPELSKLDNKQAKEILRSKGKMTIFLGKIAENKNDPALRSFMAEPMSESTMEAIHKQNPNISIASLKRQDKNRLDAQKRVLDSLQKLYDGGKAEADGTELPPYEKVHYLYNTLRNIRDWETNAGTGHITNPGSVVTNWGFSPRSGKRFFRAFIGDLQGTTFTHANKTGIPGGSTDLFATYVNRLDPEAVTLIGNSDQLSPASIRAGLTLLRSLSRANPNLTKKLRSVEDVTFGALWDDGNNVHIPKALSSMDTEYAISTKGMRVHWPLYSVDGKKQGGILNYLEYLNR